MARNIYGLDLGTYEIKVYDKKQDSTWKEKNVIAIVDGKEILAVGDEAYAMFERTPGNIEVVFPMKEGVISRSSSESAEERAPFFKRIRISDRSTYGCHRS